MLAELGVGDDAVAVAGFEGGIDVLDLVERRQRLFEFADAMQIHSQSVHGLEIMRIDLQGLLVGVDRFFGAVQLIERQAEVEEPPRVIGIDGDGGLELIDGFLELALLVEFGSSLHPTFGIVPVVHDLPHLGRRSMRHDRASRQPVRNSETRRLLYSSRGKIRKASACQGPEIFRRFSYPGSPRGTGEGPGRLFRRGEIR